MIIEKLSICDFEQKNDRENENQTFEKNAPQWLKENCLRNRYQYSGVRIPPKYTAIVIHCDKVFGISFRE